MTTNTQIQIRIDKSTKNKAKKVFESIGLDMSSAIKMFLCQTINAGTLPYNVRDENGFTFEQIRGLKKELEDAKRSHESYNSIKEMIDSIYK